MIRHLHHQSILMNDNKNNSTIMGKIITFLGHLLSLFLTFIAPMQVYLIVTFVNIFIDFGLGVYKAIIYDKKKWSREKLMLTFQSLILFFVAFSMGLIMETFLVPSLPIVVTIAITINTFFFFRSLKKISLMTGTDVLSNIVKLFKKSYDNNNGKDK